MDADFSTLPSLPASFAARDRGGDSSLFPALDLRKTEYLLRLSMAASLKSARPGRMDIDLNAKNSGKSANFRPKIREYQIVSEGQKAALPESDRRSESTAA